MKIYRKLEQGSQEWLDHRMKKLTGSHAQAIQAGGAGLETLLTKKVLELIHGIDPDRFYGEEMKRGHRIEPLAILAYEMERGVNVEQIGFIDINEWCGVSPDGLVGSDGLIECKARNNKIHLKLLMDKKIDSKSMWQCQMLLYGSKRKWCDYVSYNPAYDKSLFIERVFPDADKFKKLDVGIKDGIVKFKKKLSNPIVKHELKMKKNVQ